MGKKVRSFIVTAAVILLGFVIQSAILPHIAIASISPNLMLIIVVNFGFFTGEEAGLFCGLAAGLLCDIFFGPLLGFTGLLYAFVGFVSGKFKRILYVEDLWFMLLLIAAADLGSGFAKYIFLFLIRNRLFLHRYFLEIMLPEAVFTTVLGAAVSPLLRLIYEKFVRIRRENPLESQGI